MIVQEPNRRDPRVRKRRAYTLLVDYPAEPTSPRTFNNEDGEAVFCEGPSVQLPTRVSVALAMVLHELATNAAK